MLRIIELLQEKNHYLEKFYSLNEEEIINFSNANFDGLEEFYQTREHILQMVSYIDVEIQKCDLSSAMPVSLEARDSVRECLAIKDGYVNRILAQDLEILASIERAKSAIIRELQDVRKAKRAVGGYHSGTPAHRLNEEA